jgi:hypothetical protein
MAYVRKVRQISTDLSSQRPLSTDDIIRQVFDGRSAQRKQQAMDALWALMTSPRLAQIVDFHGFERAELDGLIANLVAGGGGQWVGNQYVPVSALAYPKTLHYALGQRGKVNFAAWVHTLIQMVETRDYWLPIS